MHNLPPELNQSDAGNRELVGVCVLFFLNHHPDVKELKLDLFQEWAKKGLLKRYSLVYFDCEPPTENIVPWFLNHIFLCLSSNKNSNETQFKRFIDKICAHDMAMLEKQYQIMTKYGLNIEELKFNSSNFIKKIGNDDRDIFEFCYFSDAILSSIIIILSHYYEEWFNQTYKFQT